MLVLDSPYDILLGLPFMRHRCLTQHYCNNTLHTVSPEGAHITIPLESSNLRIACTHKCPFQHLSLPTDVDIKSAVNPFDSITPKMIMPSAYTTQTNNVSMCHNIVTAKQMHIPMCNSGISIPNDVISKYNTENRSITLNNVGIPKNNDVIPSYNIDVSNIPLNSNVILNSNSSMPYKNNVIPIDNIENQYKTLNNNIIPVNDSVIPQCNDAIPMNNDGDKSIMTIERGYTNNIE